jgi:pyruvate formate lyase activating enzyme
MQALVGNIGRYALHDGPGIRTTVFFKGCRLQCPWCHNPELLDPRPAVAFHAERCILCGDCLAACPEEAVDMASTDRILRDRCTGCGLCARQCPSGALETIGRRYGLEELVDVLLRDRLFYESSGGGVTLSGGEPTMHMPFIGALLRRLHHLGIHTALQTSGDFDFPAFADHCLAHLDLIFFDVKIADRDRHRQVTGRDNKHILANLSRLAGMEQPELLVRIPVIPGYTAEADNMAAIADILRQHGIRRYALLPYHPHGMDKAAGKGMAVHASLPAHAMTQEELHWWHRFFHGMEPVGV